MTLSTRDTYIDKKQLDSNDVQRDYNFLLKVNRSLDLGKRRKSEMKILKTVGNRRNGNFSNNGINSKWVPTRGVKVKKVPLGMERGKLNKSGGKGNNWAWTIEWLLIDENKKVIDRYVKYKSGESSILRTIVPRAWICGGDEYTILFKDLESGVFEVVDKDAKLSEVLLNKLVIEFPTMYMFKGDSSIITREKVLDDDLSSGSSDSDASSDSSSDSDTPPEESSSKPLET